MKKHLREYEDFAERVLNEIRKWARSDYQAFGEEPEEVADEAVILFKKDIKTFAYDLAEYFGMHKYEYPIKGGYNEEVEKNVKKFVVKELKKEFGLDESRRRFGRMLKEGLGYNEILNTAKSRMIDYLKKLGIPWIELDDQVYDVTPIEIQLNAHEDGLLAKPTSDTRWDVWFVYNNEGSDRQWQNWSEKDLRRYLEKDSKKFNFEESSCRRGRMLKEDSSNSTLIGFGLDDLLLDWTFDIHYDNGNRVFTIKIWLPEFTLTARKELGNAGWKVRDDLSGGHKWEWWPDDKLRRFLENA